jgi:hypothetical protein
MNAQPITLQFFPSRSFKGPIRVCVFLTLLFILGSAFLSGGALTTLVLNGTTAAGQGPFTTGAPFSVRLTYDASTPRTFFLYPGDTGAYYQNAILDLVFNYNNGEYIGATVSADIVIAHGATTSRPPLDLFWVTGIDGEGFAPVGSLPFSRVNSAFGISAPFGAAFTDTSLPTELSTPPFGQEYFDLVWLQPTGGPSIEFLGSISSISTIPEPSSFYLACFILGLPGVARFTRAATKKKFLPVLASRG